MMDELPGWLARALGADTTLTPFGNVPWEAAALRMAAALILGGVIGWEREQQDKSAGLRTHMMIALAACIFTLVTFDLMTLGGESDVPLRLDPIRLVEAVTAGVAFLAAGTIILQGDKVRGLTTGAGMWLAGAIGLACGIGNLVLAVTAAILALFVLWLLRLIARSGRHGDRDGGP